MSIVESQCVNTFSVQNDVFDLFLRRMKLLGALLTLHTFFGFGLVAQASDQPRSEASCSTLEFSESLGEPRFQSDSGWCFAFAASDLISFYLKQKVSAVDVAIQEVRMTSA